MATKLYKVVDVWKRKKETVVRYRCFEVLPDHTFCVQSADYYRPPFSSTQTGHQDKQFMELLMEEAPDSRSKPFPSLEEAIRAFDRDFTNEGRVTEGSA